MRVVTISLTCALVTTGMLTSSPISAATDPDPVHCSPVTSETTLDDAIAEVNAGECDTISISHDLTFTTGAPTAIEIATTLEPPGTRIQTLTIQGTGTGTVTLTGPGPGLAITLGADQDLVISNLKFTSFSSPSSGGALSVQGGDTVSIRESILNDNEVTSSGNAGGAISVSGASSLNIENSDFARNTAEESGGAIQFESPGVGGVMTVRDSEFVSNSSEGPGGAIRLRNPARMNIEGGFFWRNTAGVQGTVDAAGVRSPGGAISSDGVVVSSDSIYQGNIASTEGGAIATSASVESTLDNFLENDATGVYWGASPPFVIQSGKGGAVAAPTGFTSLDTVMSQNYAREYGGAVSACPFSDETSQFEDNEAGQKGGALHCVASATATSVTVDGTKFITNTAGESGGAIFTDGSVTVRGDVPFTVSGTTKFEGNSSGLDGGAIAVVSPTGSPQVVDITGAVFESNSALDTGGAIHIPRSGDQLSVSGTRFGGPSRGNSSGWDGGAIASGGSVTVANADFEGNWSGAVGTYEGGGAISAGGAVDLTNVHFNDNWAVLGGGGAVYTASTFTARDSIFEANSTRDSNGNGGAVFARGRVGVTGGSEFRLNRSAAAAGAIAVGNMPDASDAVVEDSQFIGNEAVGQGGALLVTGDLEVQDSLFSGNEAGAAGGGGALVVGEATVSRSTFSENLAVFGTGAALYASSLISNSTSFIENDALYGGGGAFVSQRAQISNSTFYRNTSTSPEGAAIQFGSAMESAILSFSTFADSVAALHPLIFYFDSDPSEAPVISLIGSVLAPGVGTSCGWLGSGALPLKSTTRNSIATDDSCDSSEVANVEHLDEDLDLGPLVNGLEPGTQVLRPDPGSVLNSYTPSLGVTTDQLGAVRPEYGFTSVGAVQAYATTFSGPHDASVEPGTSPTFTVNADRGLGSGATYRWQSSSDGVSWSNITGNASSRTATLVLPSVTLAQSGLRVRVNVTKMEDGPTAASEAATLTVSTSPGPEPSPSNTPQPSVVVPQQPVTNQPSSQAPGTAGFVIDGQVIPVRTESGPRGSGLTLKAGPVEFTLRSQTANGRRVPLAPDGSLILPRTGEVPISGDGLQPNSTVAVTLFSDPVSLGATPVGADGKFKVSPVIPATVPLGVHTLQLSGRTKNGDPFVLSVGVLVETPAAALGADPIVNVRPAALKPGASVAVTARGVQAGCRVTFAVAGERAPAKASTKGTAQAQITLPKRLPEPVVLRAAVSGPRCSAVTVSKEIPSRSSARGKAGSR